MALKFVQKSTIRNRELIWEKDPEVRSRRHEELRQIAADPEKARTFLLRSSMISGLREAESID
jgi:3-(3-hydroxy-phenyl)propionate hydroxylase